MNQSQIRASLTPSLYSFSPLIRILLPPPFSSISPSLSSSLLSSYPSPSSTLSNTINTLNLKGGSGSSCLSLAGTILRRALQACWASSRFCSPFSPRPWSTITLGRSKLWKWKIREYFESKLSILYRGYTHHRGNKLFRIPRRIA